MNPLLNDVRNQVRNYMFSSSVFDTSFLVFLYSLFGISYCCLCPLFFFFFSSRRRHTRSDRDWSSDVCSSDLQAVAAQAAAERRRDIPAAESIVSEEVERFWAWYGGLVVVPVLKEFRERLDQVRAAELERALRRLAHLSPDDRGESGHFSHTLLKHFL